MARYLKFALPKGRLADSVFSVLEKAGYKIEVPKKTRKLVVTDEANQFKYYFVKPSDVVTYVDEGVCDIGVVGKDTILESSASVYELFDLGIGKCKMVVAGLPNYTYQGELRVATKYPKIAREYYAKTNQTVNIVKLNGSVELGPILGLSDVIVDIYETGRTLRANGLEVIDDFLDISSRVIANKASYRQKYTEIKTLLNRLEQEGE
ncbi:MAG: ATP phosphoribosyltransferase [Candidatus Izemoplasma sp.]|nr:ATP phosphoribosyltransferase [Candidatus Izemoplasma sp.]